MEQFTTISKNNFICLLEDCPVQAEKHNILFNNKTGKNVIQIMFRSRSEKAIKSVFAEIDCFDDAKDRLGTIKDISYLNVNAVEGKTFGDRQAVNTGYKTVSSIDIKITKIVFSDETIWRNETEAFLEKMPIPEDSAAVYKELCSQYKRECQNISAADTYAYKEDENFWVCSCGQYNSIDDNLCFVCKADKNKIKNINDKEYLARKNDEYNAAMEAEQLRIAEERKAEEAKKQAEAEKEAAELQMQTKKALKIGIPATVLVCIIFIVITKINIYTEKSNSYQEAVAIAENGKYSEAIEAFESLDGFKDSEDKIEECKQNIYDTAVSYVENKDYKEATVLFRELGNYKDSFEKYKEAINCMNLKNSKISAGGVLSLGIKSDNSVIAVGYNGESACNTDDWTDIIAVSAGYGRSVGLKSDGTVVAIGSNEYGQCNVTTWTNITAISAGYAHTVGLKSDGTVVAVGYEKDGECNVDNWSDIIAISAGSYHTVGLKSDGTVVAVGDNSEGECNVGDWSDIIAISAGCYYTVGLKSDGTVVAVGCSDNGRCNVYNWSDIVAVSAKNAHTVGLKSDGTVVAVGDNENGQCNIDNWSDIIAISAGYFNVLGLKSDGTVVAVGYNGDGECDVDNWTDIKVY